MSKSKSTAAPKPKAPKAPPIVVVDMTQAPAPAPEASKRKPAIVVPPTPVPVKPATRIEAGGVSAEGRERAASDEAMAREAGFAPKPPIYALGTLINQTGVENLTRSRQDWEKLPTVAAAMASLAKQVRSEEREDIPALVSEARMTEDGRLRLGDGTDLAMTRNGLRLLSHRLIGSYDYMAKCPPALRALNVNHWMGREDSTLVLRTRKGKEGREVYGVVSERYSPLDVDRVAEMIARVAPSDARCDVTYDGLELTANVLFHPDIVAQGGVAGEVF